MTLKEEEIHHNTVTDPKNASSEAQQLLPTGAEPSLYRTISVRVSYLLEVK